MNRRKVTEATPPSWVLVVRENATAYERRALLRRVDTSDAVRDLLWPRIAVEEVEVMYVLALDCHNQVKHMAEVSRGGLHGCSVSARDVLRTALYAAAAGFILVHNHPSGDPRPSEEDRFLTRKLAAAAEVLGVPLVDHVIIGSASRHYSFLDSEAETLGGGAP